MQLSSPAFSPDRDIPRKYTSEGTNLSPPLHISDVPSGSETLMLLVEDVDSPMGWFTQWLVWNIPASTTEIAENRVPEGAEVGMNGFGQAAYGGPAPPSGRHRYRFRLVALDTKLEATTPDRKDHVLSEMEGHVLEETTMIGHYQASA